LKESNGEEKSVLRNPNQRKKTKEKSVLRNTNQQQRKKKENHPSSHHHSFSMEKRSQVG
jgi:hypothetical protein